MFLNSGFESNGGVWLRHTGIGGDLNCAGGRFINPDNVAIMGEGADIAGSLDISSVAEPFEADGTVDFAAAKIGIAIAIDHARFNGAVDLISARVGTYFAIDHASLIGKMGEPHGLFAGGINVKGAFIWQNVSMDRGAKLDVTGTSVQYFLTSRNWPAPGNLMLSGLTYSFLGPYPGAPPWDAHTYLTFLRLQPSFSPQPYRELAKAMRENGDEEDAIRC